MTPLQRAWYYLVKEPLQWLFYYLFQPSTFHRMMDSDTVNRHRLSTALRLAFLLFWGCFCVSLLARMLLYALFPQLYDLPFPPNFFVLTPDIVIFCFDTFWVTALCIAVGVILTLFFGFVVGTTIGVTLTLASAICIQAAYDSMVALIFGLSFGVLAGLTFVTNRTTTRKNMLGLAIGILFGITCGSLAGIFGGFLGGVCVGLLGGPPIAPTILGSVVGGVVAGSMAGWATYFLMNVVERDSKSSVVIGDVGRRLGLTLSGTFSVAVGINIGDAGLQIASFRAVHLSDLLAAISLGGQVSAVVALTFLIGYVTGYYRLPLYPISVLSLQKAYHASLRDPEHTFTHLHRSSLHWDERVCLPLLPLKAYLRFALEQKRLLEQITNEITFIAMERPTQIEIAHLIALETSISFFEQCDNLFDLHRLANLFPRLLPPIFQWYQPSRMHAFDQIREATVAIAHYFSPLTWELKYATLQSAQQRFIYATNEIMIGETSLEERLKTRIQFWQHLLQQEMNELVQTHDKYTMSNPFIVGPSIAPDTHSFVGRTDMAQKLITAFTTDDHPIVLVHGERHTGKSSFLLNLKDLLNTHYIPVIYTMQAMLGGRPATFLSRLTREIGKRYLPTGTTLKELTYTELQATFEQNEAQMYRVFDHWSKRLEQMLAHDNKVLVLAFDEFEAFESLAHFEGLLRCLNNLQAHTQHLRLLFCGMTTFEQLSPSWTTTFATAVSLKLAFLQPTDAYRLITRLVPIAARGLVFNRRVVRQILSISAGHPFFLQGICSALVDTLNNQGRTSSSIADVAEAAHLFLEKWWHEYFLDLWQRCDDQQKLVLSIVSDATTLSLPEIQQRSGIAQHDLQTLLAALIQRDLLTQTQQGYGLAAPLLHDWIDYGKRYDIDNH